MCRACGADFKGALKLLGNWTTCAECAGGDLENMRVMPTKDKVVRDAWGLLEF